MSSAALPLAQPPRTMARSRSGLRRIGAWLGRAASAGWKTLAGGLLASGALGAVLIIGWTYRACHRLVLKQWWRAAVREGYESSFSEFVASDPWTAPARRWPNWVVANAAGPRDAADEPGGAGRIRAFLARLTHSLRWNLRLGLKGIVTTWALTLPACALWLLGWHAGWNNSFHKGYELAFMGVSTAWLGIAWFLAVMLYLPMAQMRLAATGRARAFFQFRLLWTLVSRRPFHNLAVSALFALAGVPTYLLITAPGFFPQINPAVLELSNEQLLILLNRYFFWVCLTGFCAYVGLRLAAARLYAAAMVSAVRAGVLPAAQLYPEERRTLERLGLALLAPSAPAHPLLRTAARSTRLTARIVAFALTVLVWFAFTSQVFVAQFLNYHPVQGWLNQPLVQLPWFKYVPPHLRGARR